MNTLNGYPIIAYMILIEFWVLRLHDIRANTFISADNVIG